MNFIIQLKMNLVIWWNTEAVVAQSDWYIFKMMIIFKSMNAEKYKMYTYQIHVIEMDI